MNRKGISNPLSYVALAIVLLSIGSIASYFFIYKMRIMSEAVTKELGIEEKRLMEKISLIYWGPNYCILSNDGEIKIIIKKIYVDSNIITTNIIINPHEKIELSIPSGNNLMIETSNGKIIKLKEG